LKWLRKIATTAAATAIGIVDVAMHRRESIVELKTGPAPDFSLPGSDGRANRLKDLVTWTSTKRSAPRPTAATRSPG
jgi:hypothetical protein